jgi:hypothetical protein
VVPKVNRVDENEPNMDELWPATTIEVWNILPGVMGPWSTKQIRA